MKSARFFVNHASAHGDGVLQDLAGKIEIYRLEVGLPSDKFPHLAATEAFYLNNGFTTIGLRMRRLL